MFGIPDLSFQLAPTDTELFTGNVYILNKTRGIYAIYDYKPSLSGSISKNCIPGEPEWTMFELERFLYAPGPRLNLKANLIHGRIKSL